MIHHPQGHVLEGHHVTYPTNYYRTAETPTPPLPPTHRVKCAPQVRFSSPKTISEDGDFRWKMNHNLLLRNDSSQSAGTVHSYTTSCTKETLLLDRLSKYDDLEEEQGFEVLPGMTERDMNSFHQRIPGLRRQNIQTAAIRQHYYPEGGWGWIVCACAFLVQGLTTGLQFSFGVVAMEMMNKFGEDKQIGIVWVGCLCIATTCFTSSIVIGICQKKSTRLMAVFGGLVIALACLFTSFAQQLHQIFFSYSVMLGLGISMTSESAHLMIGQYFKRKREFVEILVHSGTGIGVTVLPVFFREVIGQLGWRIGIQAVTGLLTLTVLLGIFYRSASLYHPQRKIILHLKSQKRKVKDKEKKLKKPPYFDFTILRSRSLQVFMLSSSVSSLGIYTPLFYLGLEADSEGISKTSVILLYTYCGVAYVLGCLAFGILTVKQSNQCMISRQYLYQASVFGIGLSIISLASVEGFHGYALFMWMYGAMLGGCIYTTKMLTLERIKAKHFFRAWGFLQGAKSLPILVGAPIAGYINVVSSKGGYYFAAFFTIFGGVLLFLFNIHRHYTERQVSLSDSDCRYFPEAFRSPHDDFHHSEHESPIDCNDSFDKNDSHYNSPNKVRDHNLIVCLNNDMSDRGDIYDSDYYAARMARRTPPMGMRRSNSVKVEEFLEKTNPFDDPRESPPIRIGSLRLKNHRGLQQTMAMCYSEPEALARLGTGSWPTLHLPSCPKSTYGVSICHLALFLFSSKS